MAKATVDISGFLPALEAMIDDRLGSACEEMAGMIEAEIAFPYPPASKPGRPPHKRSGRLLSDVFVKRVGKMDWAFGYRDEEHGLYMELGTGVYRQRPIGDGRVRPNPNSGARTSVAPRPAILPVLMEEGRGVVTAHLAGG